MDPQKLVAAVAFASAASFGTPSAAQARDVIEAAQVTLSSIQAKSFTQNREYCGLIGRNAEGTLLATRPRKGREDSCLPRLFFQRDIEVLASYHTHGGQLSGQTVELPSSYDLQADAEEEIFGFVSTPGGRFWVTEPLKNRVRMLCDAGCLPQDPAYDATLDTDLKPLYTAQELEQLEAGG